MRYISTRGRAASVDFEGALFAGYAADGGLFMPEKIPFLDYTTLQKWSNFSYPELVKQLCSIFISPELIPTVELNDLIDRAYSRFKHKDVVHLSRLKNDLNVLELWHGVTYAFKDLSLCVTGQFLQYFLKKKKKHITILVGTSGDTGSAAIESVRGEKNMDIFVLLPHGLCSQVQELQMTTVIEENVHVFLAEGNSDEIDEPIKELFADEDFSRRHNLMTLNSVNWSRILVQMAHYFYAYFRSAPFLDAPPLPIVEIIVPTGGAGNLTEFQDTECMNVLLRFSSVMQEPYNMERILWLISDSDSNLIKSLMEEFNSAKKVKLPEELQKKLSEELMSCSVSEEEIVQTMRRCWEDNHYLLCPHTAVAVSYHYKHPSCQPSIARCFLAPASPVKFNAAVLKAGLTPEDSSELSTLKEMETRSSKLKREEDWAKILRHQIEAVTKQRNPILS
ncbi:hypothetical protein lerEdw1_017490 [Lerista edwardsae]|nr:hypothetical protein lerEdw1_017490 [Lerista edwardsae]